MRKYVWYNEINPLTDEGNINQTLMKTGENYDLDDFS